MNQTRRNKIVELLEKQGAVTNAELIQTFGISIETVRRDLAYLEERGLLERVYGGAVKKKFLRTEPNYVSRETENAKEKDVISTQAEKLLEFGDAVFFDLGTTVLSVAQKISSDKQINAFTNSLRTAIVLAERCNVTLSGGQVRNGEFAVSGSIAESNMQKFNIDKAFIGVAGITEDGITDFIPQEAGLRSQVIENANKVIVVADYSKFGVRAMCNVCSLDKIDVLITDDKAPTHILKECERKGVQIIIAK